MKKKLQEASTFERVLFGLSLVAGLGYLLIWAGLL